MSYQLFLKRSAEKELSELTGKTHDRIVKKLLEMRENPLPRGVRKLQGREGYRTLAGRGLQSPVGGKPYDDQHRRRFSGCHRGGASYTPN